MSFRLIFNIIFFALLGGCLAWWLIIPAPSGGEWRADHSRISSVTRDGDIITVTNIRDWGYDADTGEPTRKVWLDRTFDLGELERTWFVLEPFGNNKAIAHTMFTFEFANGETVVVSIEARRRPEQTYQPYRAALVPTYPYLWVWATERDMFANSTFFTGDELYLYELTISPAAQRAIFNEIVLSTHKSSQRPRWYHTIFSNCTNVLARAVNRAVPRSVPWDASWYLPGYSDEFLYGEGYLDTSLPFDQAELRAFTTPHIKRLYSPTLSDYDFSSGLREEMGLPFSEQAGDSTSLELPPSLIN